ncbi:MAG: hypothetical protein JWO20_523, partial [Candidatus Angelobacter sp.]|nr:hypothetical protein [Candidatus Angelobacter sp.]
MKIVTLMSCQTRGASPDWCRVTITSAGRLGQSRQFSDPGCVAARETKRPFLATRLLSATEEQWVPRSRHSVSDAAGADTIVPVCSRMTGYPEVTRIVSEWPTIRELAIRRLQANARFQHEAARLHARRWPFG